MWLNHRIALDEADIFKNFKNVYQPKMGLNIVRNSKYGSLEICWPLANAADFIIMQMTLQGIEEPKPVKDDLNIRCGNS